GLSASAQAFRLAAALALVVLRDTTDLSRVPPSVREPRRWIPGWPAAVEPLDRRIALAAAGACQRARLLQRRHPRRRSDRTDAAGCRDVCWTKWAAWSSVRSSGYLLSV